MTPLTREEIIALINPDWFNNSSMYVSPPGATQPQQMFPTATLFFTDTSGNYVSYPVGGYVDSQAQDNLDDYIAYQLIPQAAQYLYNCRCTGNITNIAPPEYQVYPIYYK